jgi:IstB-like ATP binding protein
MLWGLHGWRFKIELRFILRSGVDKTTDIFVRCCQIFSPLRFLPFSGWDTIFKDPMTTKAAVDRLVHHSTILELVGTSYRQAQAQAKRKRQGPAKKDDPIQ